MIEAAVSKWAIPGDTEVIPPVLTSFSIPEKGTKARIGSLLLRGES